MLALIQNSARSLPYRRQRRQGFRLLRHYRRRRGEDHRRRGAAAAELGLVVPILVFMCVGIVDFARLIYYYEIIATCAENGALWASDPAAQALSPYATVTAAARVGAQPLEAFIQELEQLEGHDNGR